MISDKKKEELEKIALYTQSGWNGLLLGTCVVPKIADKTNKWLMGSTHPRFFNHAMATLGVGWAGVQALTAAKGDRKLRRDVLRFASATFLVGSGMHWYHGFRTKEEKKVPAALMGTAIGLTGAAGLAIGCLKYDDDKK